jgi:phosphatidylinositol alpha-mannosyltransferase
VLAPLGDPAALAERLRGVLTDPRWRAELVAAGRARVAALDWSLVAAQVIRVYETAIAADPRRVREAGEVFSPGDDR